jgi:ABC-type transporter Mla subunit MlaD
MENLTQQLEASTQQIEALTKRIEASTKRIEALTDQIATAFTPADFTNWTIADCLSNLAYELHELNEKRGK